MWDFVPLWPIRHLRIYDDLPSAAQAEHACMPTYEYETIPQRAGQHPVRFELYQPITAASLSKHPETGEPVRRVISGGLGIFTESKLSDGPSPCASGGCGMPSCDVPRGGDCQNGACGF